MTDSIRAHLRACSVLPEDLRRRVQEAREGTQMLLKHNRELLDRADVLRREIDATRAELHAKRQRVRRPYME